MKFKEFLSVFEAAPEDPFAELIGVKDNKRMFGDYLRANKKLSDAVKELALELELSGEEYREITNLTMPKTITSGYQTTTHKYKLFSVERTAALLHFTSTGLAPFELSPDSRVATLMRIRGENYIFHDWNSSNEDTIFKVSNTRMLNEYQKLADSFHKVKKYIANATAGGSPLSARERNDLIAFSWMPFV